VDNGADLSIRDNDGETPLDVAYRMKHTDAIRILESLKEQETSQ
jgi:ankyrin repeat protein